MSTEIAAETPNSEALPRLQDMTEEARSAYLSGKEEEQKETSEGGEPAKSGAASDAAEKAQEPAEEEKPGHSRFQRRIDKLTAQNKDLEAKLAKLSGTEKPAARETESSATSKAPRFREFQNQIGTKFKDWDEAHDAWESAVYAFNAEEKARAVADAIKAEREELKTKETRAEAEKTLEKNAKKFADRQAEFRKTLKADNFNEMFLEVKDALDDAISANPQYAEISQVLIESEVGPELVHYLGEHPKEFDALLQMPITRALRELGKLEVSDKIKAPTPKTHTAAKKIGDSVKGGTVTHDAIDEAVKKRDMRGFLKAHGQEIKW